METITIDGMNEDDFRRSIESMLRRDEIDEAIARLKSLLAPYVGEGGILPSRFLAVTAEEVRLSGWDELGARLDAHDEPSHPISAIGISLTDPREAGRRLDDAGRMAPCIETSYFSDSAYPFSDATREDLLDGYSSFGFEWQDDHKLTDTTLSVDGIDDLYGAIVALEARLFDSDEPSEDEIRAGSLGACYLATLIHQAARDMVRRNGLPRPLCVMAGCDGVYPFFDAPVTGSAEREDQRQGGIAVTPAWQAMLDTEDEDALFASASGEASLLNLVSRKGAKKPVIVLDREEARKAARFNEVAAAHQLNGNSRPMIGGVLDAAHGLPPAAFAEAWPEPEPQQVEPDPEEDWPVEGFAECDPQPSLPEPQPLRAQPVVDEDAESSRLPDFAPLWREPVERDERGAPVEREEFEAVEWPSRIDPQAEFGEAEWPLRAEPAAEGEADDEEAPVALSAAPAIFETRAPVWPTPPAPSADPGIGRHSLRTRIVRDKPEKRSRFAALMAGMMRWWRGLRGARTAAKNDGA